MSLSEQTNRLIIRVLTTVNALVFLLIVAAGGISGWIAAEEAFQSSGDDSFYVATIAIGLLGGIISGAIVCGAFALLLILSNDFSRIASGLEAIGQSVEGVAVTGQDLVAVARGHGDSAKLAAKGQVAMAKACDGQAQAQAAIAKVMVRSASAQSSADGGPVRPRRGS